jgi:3-carboxy-cis,cis-muconate cycloisomerase
MSTRLIESLAATEPLSRIFSDTSVLQAMLAFEAALARAEARVDVIPASAAAASQSSAEPATTASTAAMTTTTHEVRCMAVPPFTR